MSRWLVPIAICLVLGAITTVAVAWGCVLWSPRWSDVRSGDGSDPTAHDHTLGDEVADRGWPAPVPEAWPALSMPRNHYPSHGYTLIYAFDIDDSGVQYHQLALRAGWPAHALYWSREADTAGLAPMGMSSAQPGPPARVAEGIWIASLPEWLNPQPHQKLLPTMPLVRGFAIDTAFFAAAWFLPVLGVIVVRRSLRRRRGRCPECGYDLRYHHAPRGSDNKARDTNHSESGSTAGCPECGWGREGDRDEVKSEQVTR